jgi:molecular chaperone DnaK (HSP70)
MLWAREAVGGLFDKAQVSIHKNSKIITAEGAAVAAALLLDAAEGYTIKLEDKHQLTTDIGIISDSFLPLVERNAFWWQRHAPKQILLNAKVEGAVPFTLAERTADGEIKPLKDFLLTHLPKRPKGTTRLEMRLLFMSNTDLTVEVEDKGFGELFPKTDYKRQFEASLV